TTESGSAARRASAATTVAVAISATAARISRSGSVKAISLPTSLPGTPDRSEVYEPRSSDRAVRLVQEIEQMHDAHVGPCLAQAALDLHEAAGVRGDDGVRAGTHDVRDLSLEDRAREVGLRDVVRPGAPAAPVRLHERNDVEARNGGEQSARLLADLLAVEQMAGVVPGHPPVERARRLDEPEVAEVFGRVLHFRGEGRSSRRPFGVRSEERRVGKECRARWWRW